MQEKNEEYRRLSDREGILQKEQEAMRNEKVSQSFDTTDDFMVADFSLCHGFKPC